MDNEPLIIPITLFILGLTIYFFFIRWVLRINELIKLTKINALLLKKIAEKSGAITEEEKNWISEQISFE